MLKSFLKTLEDIIYNERFSTKDGFLQKIDPRIKFCSSLVLILTAITVRNILPLIILLGILFVLTFKSKISLKYLILRTVYIPVFVAIIALPLPFITPGNTITSIGYNNYLLNITFEGMNIAVQFTLRVWVCVAISVLLVLTTEFSNLIHVMEKFRIPKVFIMMLSITHRFIFLFTNESYRMVLAKEARIVNKESRLRSMKSLASMITTLFIRAYERGERVYIAMLSRGYQGRVRSLRTMKIAKQDLIFVSLIVLVCITVSYIEFLGVI